MMAREWNLKFVVHIAYPIICFSPSLCGMDHLEAEATTMLPFFKYKTVDTERYRLQQRHIKGA